MNLNPKDPKTAKLVRDVKASVRGKKYSELTKQEFDVLFEDDKNLISTVCGHNKIIDDSAKKVAKSGAKTGTKAPPKSAKVKPADMTADDKPAK